MEPLGWASILVDTCGPSVGEVVNVEDVHWEEQEQEVEYTGPKSAADIVSMKKVLRNME